MAQVRSMDIGERFRVTISHEEDRFGVEMTDFHGNAVNAIKMDRSYFATMLSLMVATVFCALDEARENARDEDTQTALDELRGKVSDLKQALSSIEADVDDLSNSLMSAVRDVVSEIDVDTAEDLVIDMGHILDGLP